MNERTANLLGVMGLAIADRLEEIGRDVLRRTGETPAALVVIGYGHGPSNEQLRRILGLSHPGSVRLIDRLVSDGLVERRTASDRRAIALYLTEQGEKAREQLLLGRLASIRPLLSPLSEAEVGTLTVLLEKMLVGMALSDLERCSLCRLCDDRACTNCPIPAGFRQSHGEVAC